LAKNYSSVILFIIISLCLAACSQTEVFEKNKSIPKHQWHYDLKPSFDFTIKDTTALYNLYIVLRHTDAYRYNNIWLNYYFQSPGDTLRKESREFQLATNDKGWLGTGMDDIYEHRIKLTPYADKVKRTGTYKFILENIMREDPLKEVLNVGIRIEKQ